MSSRATLGDEARKGMTKMLSEEKLNRINELAKKKKVTIFNHLMDKRITNNNKYFKDHVHLNKEGATLYSTIIAHEIKEYLKHKKVNKP